MNLLKMLGDGLKSIFEQDEKQTMVQANGAFINGGLHLLDQYKKALKEHFDAEFQEVNFAAAKQAAQIINSWIDKNTHGKIKDMIDPSGLSSMTRLVLANAVYFKGTSIRIEISLIKVHGGFHSRSMQPRKTPHSSLWMVMRRGFK